MLFKIFDVIVRIVLGTLSTLGTLLGLLAILVVPIDVWEGGEPYSALFIGVIIFIGTVISTLLTGDIVRGKYFELDLTRL